MRTAVLSAKRVLSVFTRPMSAVAAADRRTLGEAAAAASHRKPKVVLVIGTTGAGKSKLAVDLAKAFDGEVVNCDSIQMYRGLEIASAKVTEEEMQGVKHHLLSFLDPTEQFTVRDFRAAADDAIASILERGRLPIVVGGTMYYVQSLLRDSALLRQEEGGASEPSPKRARLASDTTRSTEDLFAELERVDPTLARKLHPNDRRKIVRGLDVFASTGKPLSEHWLEEATETSDVDDRPYDTLLLWVYANRAVLNERLDRRVDSMLEKGLLSEIQAFADELGRAGIDPAQFGETASGGPTGLLQAIGFKEFREYLERSARSSEETAPADESGAGASSLVEAARERGRRELQTATRRYAKRQLTWIRNRFVRRGERVVSLDTSDVARWDDMVAKPALETVRKFLSNEDLTALVESRGPVGATGADSDVEGLFQWRKYDCTVCGMTLNGAHEWDSHLRSRRHQKRVSQRRSTARNFLRFVDALQQSGHGDDDIRATVAEHRVFAGWTREDALAVLDAQREDSKHT